MPDTAWLAQTVAAPRPPKSAGCTSWEPGQGGMVTHRNRSDPGNGFGCVEPSVSIGNELNWNRQPVGMVNASPGFTLMASTVDGSVLGGHRHTCPLPSRMYHTSSTVWCQTGRETCPGGRVTSTTLAPWVWWRWSIKKRISEPSGAVVSGCSERWPKGGIGWLMIATIQFPITLLCQLRPSSNLERLRSKSLGIGL